MHQAAKARLETCPAAGRRRLNLAQSAPAWRRRPAAALGSGHSLLPLPALPHPPFPSPCLLSPFLSALHALHARYGVPACRRSTANRSFFPLCRRSAWPSSAWRTRASWSRHVAMPPPLVALCCWVGAAGLLPLVCACADGCGHVFGSGRSAGRGCTVVVWACHPNLSNVSPKLVQLVCLCCFVLGLCYPALLPACRFCVAAGLPAQPDAQPSTCIAQPWPWPPPTHVQASG